MSPAHETEQQQYTTEHDQQQIDGSRLTLRTLVTSKEAGIIIGKAGKNVAELRDSTGVKAGVSKVVQGIHCRVLTVTGTLEGVAKAYSLVAQILLENPITSIPLAYIGGSNIGTLAVIRLLISHSLMGTVIGRQGMNIKHIQDTTGVRMVASKVLLPQSTERVLDVRGTAEQIRYAILDIGQCLVDDKDPAYGTILYDPTKMLLSGSGLHDPHRRLSLTRTGNGTEFIGVHSMVGAVNSHPSHPPLPSFDTTDIPRRLSGVPSNDPYTQCISIPANMVGCIIGKAGSVISEIRELSGSRISIEKVSHGDSGERMFTIQGTKKSNERALYLLYAQLDAEKNRRLKEINGGDSTNGLGQAQNQVLKQDL